MADPLDDKTSAFHKMAISVLITADQSKTLYVPELDETYHSRNGALQESLYVFIEKGFWPLAKNNHNISILEVGFGTGLNAILTLQQSKELKLNVNYEALETNPLPIALIDDLSYDTLIAKEMYPHFQQMHQVSWNTPHMLTPEFNFTKLHNSLQDFNSTHLFNLIYFDAFAPDKQPELWTLEIFKKLYKMMDNAGILVTYSSKGEVKRSLREAGFLVERLPGPPRKRHMLRATK